MTRFEFNNLESGNYVEYKRYWPSADRYGVERGVFRRFSDDGDNAVIGHRGQSIIVHINSICRKVESLY